MSRQQWGHGFHAGKEAAKAQKDFPIGFYVHTFIDGDVNSQGKIVSRVDAGYGVQLYNWVDGRPTAVRVVSAETIENGVFYDNENDWRIAGDELAAHLWEGKS